MTLFDDLQRVLGVGALITDPDVVASYRYDRTTWIAPGMPLAVIKPTTTNEVAEVVRVAGRHGVNIIPRGAGTSLSGGAQGVDGALTLSLERMDRIVGIDPVDQLAIVEPGVFNSAISDAAGEYGLFYPPDPASAAFSTIGGNVATNAGGLCCVKYGVTREYVRRLEVVLADGRVIRTGADTVKGVAGLDLTSLFVGSEGMLGIVTQVTVALRPTPEPPATMVAYFARVEDAGRAVQTILAAPGRPSLLEIMDRATLGAVENYARMDLDLDAAALLVAQSDAGEAARAVEVADYAARCKDAGATFTYVSDDPHEADALLQARRLAGPALEDLGQGIWDDVAVPISKISDLIERVRHIADEHEVEIFTFGHAGDGNLHPTLLARHGDDEALERCKTAFTAILRTALELGGTITGEHGVGATKADLLETELGVDNLAVQRSIKAALDPQGLFSPGRWLDLEEAPRR